MLLGTSGCNWKRVGSVEITETAGGWLVGPGGLCRVGAACDTDGSEFGLETLIVEAELTI